MRRERPRWPVGRAGDVINLAGHHETESRGGLDDGLSRMGQSAVALDVLWFSQEIALHLFAKLTLEKVKLGVCLDAFREHRKIEGAAEPEDQTHDRGGLAIGIDRFDEGAMFESDE